MRLALRSLRRQPGFAALAITILALGIGANTAIFSVIHGSLLRPLPYFEPDRLVWLSDGHPNFGGAGADQSVPNQLDLRAGARLMQSSAIYRMASGNLATADQPERVRVLYTSSEMLSVLGVVPMLGRDLLPRDDIAGTEPVAILTDDIWRTRFGADPSVVGRTTTIDARSVRIVGVTPAGFSFPREPDILMALQHEGAEFNRGSRSFFAIGRLAPGAEVESLRQELQGIFAGLAEAYPNANEDWFTWAEPLRDYAVGRNERSLLLLGGAVALVLIIACVNVANLLLVRAETRRREFAVRYSLGARRAGLLSHFLSEGLVLSLLGGGLGIFAAHWGVDLLVTLYGGSLPRADEIKVSITALGFGLLTSLVVGIVVGLVPLVRIHPDRLHEYLKEGARGSSMRGNRLGKALVVTEVALAVLIVVGAGLLANSMWRLQQVDLGLMDEERVLTFQVSPPSSKYPDGTAIRTFFAELVNGLDAIPGVEAAGLVSRLPLVGGNNTTVSVVGNPEREAHFVSTRFVSPGFFDATSVPLVAGRWLEPAEFAKGTSSILINETLARQLFADQNPLGRRLHIWSEEGNDVVGVIGDIMGGRPDRPPPPAFYTPHATLLEFFDSQPLQRNDQAAMSVLVKAAGDPYALVPVIRQSVARLDPQLPIYAVRTLKEIALSRLGTRRFATSLFGVFAGLALLLGAVGVYGVMSYTVARRSRELGVRLALGASRGAVMRMVLNEGARLMAVGVVLGLVAALASARVLSNLLFEVSALDPATYFAVSGILTIVCLVATYAPALRATRVDPISSMRSE